MGFMNGQFADPVKTPMISRSKALWAGMNERLGIESGFRPTGAIMALVEEQVPDAESWIASQSEHPEFDYRLVSGAELKAMLPDNQNPPKIALFSPSDGSVDPALAAPAIAEVARSKGAKILQNCAVREIEFSGGKVSGVITEKGRIACNSVIVAGGYWTPLFMSAMDIRLPQVDVYLTQWVLSGVTAPDMTYQSLSYGVRKQVDGNYSFGMFNVILPIEPSLIRNAHMLRQGAEVFGSIATLGLSFGDFWDQLTRSPSTVPSPFEECRILMPALRNRPLEDALVTLKADYPAFETATVSEKWAGVISTTPDNMPYISPVTSRPGLVVGSGMEAGLSWGPAVGEALADIATGATPKFDLFNYRHDRFSDGSPLIFRS